MTRAIGSAPIPAFSMFPNRQQRSDPHSFSRGKCRDSPSQSPPASRVMGNISVESRRRLLSPPRPRWSRDHPLGALLPGSRGDSLLLSRDPHGRLRNHGVEPALVLLLPEMGAIRQFRVTLQSARQVTPQTDGRGAPTHGNVWDIIPDCLLYPATGRTTDYPTVPATTASRGVAAQTRTSKSDTLHSQGPSQNRHPDGLHAIPDYQPRSARLV
jgi:hypothetical protein